LHVALMLAFRMMCYYALQKMIFIFQPEINE